MEMDGMRFYPALKKNEAESRSSEDEASERLLREVGINEVSVRGTAMTFRHPKSGDLVTLALSEILPDIALVFSRERGSAGVRKEVMRALRLSHLLSRLEEGRARAAVKESPSDPYALPISRLRRAVNDLPGAVRNELNTFVQHQRAFARREMPAPAERNGASRRADIAFLLRHYEKQVSLEVGETDPSSFADVPDSMKRWAATEVETIRATFSDDKAGEHVVRGAALEAFAMVEIGRQRWLDAVIAPVSTFDDYRNGVDMVGEFTDPDSGKIVRCAFDLGTTVRDTAAQAKLNKTNAGAEVRFFRSRLEKRNGKGAEMRLQDIPMVILGVTGDILADLGASVREGTEIGPDHPIGIVFLRQAEIQIGLQIRKLAADLVGSALDNMPSERSTLRAVNAYADGVRSGDGFLKDVPAIRDLLKSIPVGGREYYLGRREANRLGDLLMIHGILERKIRTVDETRSDVRRIAASSTISRVLRHEGRSQPSQLKISPFGEIFLRVAWLGFFREPARRFGLEPYADGAFCRYGLVL